MCVRLDIFYETKQHKSCFKFFMGGVLNRVESVKLKWSPKGHRVPTVRNKTKLTVKKLLKAGFFCRGLGCLYVYIRPTVL